MLSDKVYRARKTSKGYFIQVAEDRCMPRIDDSYLDCTIYLYHSKRDAEKCTVHVNGGTGFLVGVFSDKPKTTHIYAVSCRHVVENASAIRLNTVGGDFDIVETSPSDWIFRNDQDVAVFPIKLSHGHNFRWIPHSSFLTKEIIARERIGPGDDVFMVGRFVNHEGKQRNTPTVRFGNLAMMPDEPVKHPNNSSKLQESFLADIRTVGGYSGSPVFVTVRTMDNRGNLIPRPSYDPWLMGVEWGYIDDHIGINTGMSGVVPAWILDDLLNDPKCVELRQQENSHILQSHATFGTQLT